jgi:hypothetical protein
MGYTTDFFGRFELDRPLEPHHEKFLRKFNETRRMKRDVNMLPKDGTNSEVGLPLGQDGEYYVDGGGFAGQDQEDNILDYNGEPGSQPGLWCKWVPSEDSHGIEWDGSEKFYEYEAWLEYIISHFLKPWGYVLNGEVTWEGEDRGDIGKLVVENNVVSTLEGEICYY